MKIVVIGGGIVGLSTAHALLEARCDVTLFDAYAIPNPASASYDRSRMMRLQYGPQRGYAHLARRALTAWTDLERTLGVRLYRRTGVCVWSATAEAWTSATRGVLLADQAVTALAAAAANKGARLQPAVAVSDVDLERGVVRTAQGVVEADAVVVATGAWTLSTTGARPSRSRHTLVTSLIPPCDQSRSRLSTAC